jgi:hypothetical protein
MRAEVGDELTVNRRDRLPGLMWDLDNTPLSGRESLSLNRRTAYEGYLARISLSWATKRSDSS